MFDNIDPEKLLRDAKKMSDDLEVQKNQIFEKLELLRQFNLFKGINKVVNLPEDPRIVNVVFDTPEEAKAFLEMFKK